MHRIIKFLLTPISLTIISFIAILMFFPGIHKYRIELITYVDISQLERKLYYDLSSKGKVAEIDKNLSIRLLNTVDSVAYNDFFELDLDGDEETEYLFLGHNNQSVIITRNNFSHPTRIDLPFIKSNEQVSIKFTNKILPQISIHYGDQELYFNYVKIKLYPYRFIIFGLVLITIFFIILLIFRAITLIRRGNEASLKTIAELKLKTIRNRLDPHFTLNVLNSIGYTFQSNDPETADYIFGKYAKLLRTTIFTSNDIYNKLSTELDYIQDYLDIEKYRMEGRFNYEINVSKEISNDLIIPKMMIHTFVENSIKHGIKPLKVPGFVSIDIAKIDKSISIQVQDNGVGRKKSNKNHDQNTGQGLKIINEMILLFEQVQGIKIEYKIVDLYSNDNKPSGTLIKILYPL